MCTVEYGVDFVGIQMGIQVNKEYRQVGTGFDREQRQPLLGMEYRKKNRYVESTGEKKIQAIRVKINILQFKILVKHLHHYTAKYQTKLIENTAAVT